MQRRLLFRADANTTIGRGHISRCLAIAGMLKDSIDILFICIIKDKTYVLNLLNGFKTQFIESDNDLIELVQKEDVLWLDGYQFSQKWKKEIRKCVYKLIETNDLPEDAVNIDVVFNHTPGIKPEQFKNVDTETDLYLGLNYALLRQNFLKHAKTITTNTLTGNGVFICFGGADTQNLGEKFTKELIKNNFKDPIYWVTNQSALEEIDYKYENLHILSNLSEKEMIYYMIEAKVILIPSSVLSFEAMALRKPIFSCYFVDNQKLIYDGLVKLSLASGVGYVEDKNEVRKGVLDFMNYYFDYESHKMQLASHIVALDGMSGEKISKIIELL